MLFHKTLPNQMQLLGEAFHKCYYLCVCASLALVGRLGGGVVLLGGHAFRLLTTALSSRVPPKLKRGPGGRQEGS